MRNVRVSGNSVDDLVLVGSPGVEVSTASQLHVPLGHVFAAAAKDDGIARIHYFGGDGLPGTGEAPTDGDFGAVHLRVDGGPTLLERNALPSEGHSEYFNLHTESVDNMALVVTGQSGQVTTMPMPKPVPPPDPDPTPAPSPGPSPIP